MKNRSARVCALLAVVAVLASSSAPAASFGPERPAPAGELLLKLKKLRTLGSVLYVAAHPDDENTAMIATFAEGRLMRTGYLAVTRGDGGQNLIGSELGPSLGLIRTQELLSARRIDSGEQMFTRAIDFGYSKTAEETFRTWGHEEVLRDVVRAVRTFRPDVVVARFPETGDGATDTTRPPRSSRTRRSSPRATRSAFPSRSPRGSRRGSPVASSGTPGGATASRTPGRFPSSWATTTPFSAGRTPRPRPKAGASTRARVSARPSGAAG
ncbi:MAG: PIG-L family deacetylase [Holophagales bacterium]|nr:PIG-L family deacetylase [Holophagales bacterium]